MFPLSFFLSPRGDPFADIPKLNVKAIPFLPVFHDKIRQGKKTMTARTTQYGKAGDVLLVEHSKPPIFICLRSVRLAHLGHVAMDHYAEEGLSSPIDFIDIWVRLHPNKGWQPEQLVWLHEFRV